MLAILPPILAFVAMGFDHVVANTLLLPAAILADVPGIGRGDAIHDRPAAPEPGGGGTPAA